MERFENNSPLSLAEGAKIPRKYVSTRAEYAGLVVIKAIERMHTSVLKLCGK